MGFLPNSLLILARRPEILQAFQQLGMAINGPRSTIDPQLRNTISQLASRAAGCGYGMGAYGSQRRPSRDPGGKEAALWEYETSPRFPDAERAALRVAQGSQCGHRRRFRRAEKHYTEAQIVDIVAVIVGKHGR